MAFVAPERGAADSPSLAALRNGLRELGYVDGRNLVIDTWWGDGSSERIEKLAGEIEAARPRVIVAAGGYALFPLLRAGVKLPVVFVVSADPVLAGIVPNLARPGGNLTGMSLLSLDLVAKRLEIVREALPRIRRIALVANPDHAGEPLELKAARDAAARLELSQRYFAVRTQSSLEQALADIARGRDEAILAFSDGFIMSFAQRFAGFSVAQNIPTISGWAAFAQRGNLLSYGPVIDECYRRLAAYVDKIHNGTKPGDLPIELPTKVELVVNLRTAGALGITIPQSLLARADQVIQ